MRVYNSESGAGLLVTIFGAAIAISVGYFAIEFIQSVKSSRYQGKSSDISENRPPPRSREEVGAYEVEVKPFTNNSKE